MTVPVQTPARPDIIYPESDGKPMADNTVQARWIVVLHGNLAYLFHNADVFVAMDLFWYPVLGHPEIVIAPDVFVAFGRPPGDRRSYRQWEEGGVAPQVVFEILSPGNRVLEMRDKFLFYQQYGVEEYYVYDPEENRLEVWRRRSGRLHPVRRVNGLVSPRLGIRFDLSGPEMVVRFPDGRPFRTFEEEMVRQAEMEAEAQRERKARRSAERRAATAARRAEASEQRAEEAQRRAEELARRLRALGVDPNGGLSQSH